MPINGLSSLKKPFIYLDEYITSVDWEKLHADVCYGLSQCPWDKKFVSSGVHPEWSKNEITPYMVEIIKHVTDYEKTLFDKCSTIAEKIKFTQALLPVSHPFWTLCLRDNKRIEMTGVKNKAVGAECFWTDNVKFFPTLVKFIKTLPFDQIGRVIFFITESNNQTVPHYDYYGDPKGKLNDDFIWFTTKPNSKSVYIMDGETKEKFYPDPSKQFVWFNEMDFHGTEPVPHFSFSIRVDGVFRSDIQDVVRA
jgi:hypothetical protein